MLGQHDYWMNLESTYKMLSVEECREILGKIAEGLADERVKEIRDSLYQFTGNVIDHELGSVRNH